MSQKAIHISKTNNTFWNNPITIIGFAILVFGSGFTCGIYYQKNESNLEAIKVCGAYNNTLNEERNKHTLDACKYENEITILKQK